MAAREVQMKPEHLRSAAARALEGGEIETNKHYWCARSVTRGETPEWGVVHIFCPECGCGFARRFETLECDVRRAAGDGNPLKLCCGTRYGGCGTYSVIRFEDLGIPIMETQSHDRTTSEWETVFRMSAA